jgi:hypothetical protein
MNSVQQFSPNAVSQYQSPYTQQVVNSTMAQLNQNDEQQQQQLLGQAIQSGASPFGGDRAGIAAATLANQQDLANNQTVAGLQNQGYSQALGELNNQQQLQLSGTTANDWLQQGAAAQENGLGTTAQNNALSAASAQLQSGGLGQQLAQEQLNVPYEQYAQQQAYPYQNLSALEQAAGIAGGLAGGTSSTTSPSPSALSQVGGLGLTGLGLYNAGAFDSLLGDSAAADGGYDAFASSELALAAKGGAIHRDMGGNVPLPGVPNVSMSFIPQGNTPQIAHGNIPRPPQPTNISQNNPFSTQNVMQELGGMKGLGGSGFADGGVADNTDDEPDMDAPDLQYPKQKPIKTKDITGEDDMEPFPLKRVAGGATSPYLSQGGYGMNYGGFSGAGGLGGSSGFNVSSLLQLLSGLGLGGNQGGSTYSAFNPTGPNIPQINQSALSGQNTTPQNFSNPLPQISNSQPTYTPQSITNPATSQGYNQGMGGWRGFGGFGMGGMGSMGQQSSGASPSPSPTTGASIAPVAGTSLSSIPAAAGTAAPAATSPSAAKPGFVPAYPGASYGQLNGNPQLVNANGTPYTPMAVSKKGGAIGHYDDGGVTNDPTANALQGANPNLQNYYQQLSLMPQEKLQQLAIQIPPSTPQGKLVQSALQAKRMNPAQGLGGATAPMAPAAPTAGTMGLASGGIGKYATDGPVQPADGSNDAQDFLTTLASSPQTALDGGPDNQARDYSANPATGITPAQIEAQKDPDTQVDHSGDTVVVKHPSNGESIDLGIPSQKDQQFRSAEPLIAAGLGMMSGTSPFAAVNIGRGGLEGLKAYDENRTMMREEAQQQATAQNQQGELAARNKEIAQTGQYQQGQLGLRAQEIANQAKYQQGELANQAFEHQKPIPDGFGGFIIPNPKDPANPTPVNLGGPGGDATKQSVANIYNPPTDKDGNPLRGEEFLKTIPAPIAAQARLYMKGDAAPPTGFAAKPTLLAAQQAAAIADPTWTGQRYSTIQDFTKGPQTARTVQAQNVTMEHIGTLQDAINALNNGDVRQFNRLSQEVARQAGSPVPTNFNLGKTIVYDEMAKAILGANSAVSDRQAFTQNMDNGSSRAQAMGQLQEAGKYMAGQAYGLEQRYTAGSGLTNYRERFMTPAARKLIDKFYPSDGQSQGTNSQATPSIPSVPKGVPAGSMYSPSKQMWKDSGGKLYDSGGKPI